MKNAAKIVSDAILGLDFKIVTVAGKVYQIDPPTIRRLAGAAGCLALFAEHTNAAEMITDAEGMEKTAEALSWFIDGTPSLAKELSEGTPKELAEGLETAYTLLSVADFMKLSALAKNVARLAAIQRR